MASLGPFGWMLVVVFGLFAFLALLLTNAGLAIGLVVVAVNFVVAPYLALKLLDRSD